MKMNERSGFGLGLVVDLFSGCFGDGFGSTAAKSKSLCSVQIIRECGCGLCSLSPTYIFKDHLWLS